ncbi:hypothetical protein FOCC_FOCC011811 [Frankliniella occidentalis]|nr:hypothetical protein FOCC_FOCC011811 [Frankliniella occidentalis]
MTGKRIFRIFTCTGNGFGPAPWVRLRLALRRLSVLNSNFKFSWQNASKIEHTNHPRRLFGSRRGNELKIAHPPFQKVLSTCADGHVGKKTQRAGKLQCSSKQEVVSAILYGSRSILQGFGSEQTKLCRVPKSTLSWFTPNHSQEEAFVEF